MGELDTDLDLAKRCHCLARSGAFAVAWLGAAVLIGWALDITVLKSVFSGGASMKANTALGLLLAGTALVLSARARVSARQRLAYLVLATSVGGIGLLSVGEYALDIDFGIDQILFAVPAEGAAPGRMAAATATALAFTGLALFNLDRRQSFLPAQAAALLGALIGVLATLWYAYGGASPDGVGASISIAPHTALGIIAINTAILLSRPRRGLMAVVISETAGGVMARRLLPLALIAPSMLGWFLATSDDMGFASPNFSVALVSLTYIILFSTVVWRTARLLRNSHLGRLAALDAEQKHQAQLSGIIDSAMDAIIMIDAAHNITLFNPAAERMFGRKAGEVLGGTVDILIPPRFREGHAESIRGFGDSGLTNRRGAFTAIRASGEEFPIEASVSHVDTKGSRSFTIILRDISDRLRAEQALIASRRQLTTMIAQAPISIAMFDRDMNYLATSRRWLAEWGAGYADLTGRNHYEVVPGISEVWKKVHRDGMAGITTRNDSDLWFKADGSRRWLRWAVHPWVEERGEVGGIIVSVEDITHFKLIEMALRASEDDLNRAQAVGSIGSWRLDVQRNELTWSSENYRIFGVSEGTPLSYETFLSRVHPADRDYVDRKWQEALAGDSGDYDIEHRVVADGKVVWVREKAELEFDAEGRLLGGFGITQDITGRRLAEEQLKNANDRLAAVAAERAANLRELSGALTLAEQRERDHLYELLHDHVQPLLVAVRLGLSGLGEQTSKEGMLLAVDEAKELISQVIQTARTLSVELSPPLIRERGLGPALESHGRWVRSKYGLDVALTCDPDTEPASMTIRLLCFNAIRELLMNVVKYAGTPQVVLHLQREEPDMLRITVRDNGVGFDLSKAHEGSGLANLERRFGMVGGCLSIESCTGGGTTATILAPLEISTQKRPRTLSMWTGNLDTIDGANI